MNVRNYISSIILILLILVNFIVLSNPSRSITQDLSDIQVAFYDGEGAWEYGRVVMINLFEWMGCNITMVRGDDIINGCLVNFDVLYWPGGHYPAYWDEMGLAGKLAVQEFVRKGGGYLGICAGGYYACDYIVWMDDSALPAPTYKVEGDELNLDLCPGVAIGPIFEIVDRPEPGYAMTRIDIINRSHPITDSLPEYMQIIYIGGPYFELYEGRNVTVLGTYNVTGTPAIVALPYGDGWVFLIGPHAEVEEESDRDGQDPTPELSDEGSDWPLLFEAMKWITQTPDLLKQTSSTTTQTSAITSQTTNLALDGFLIFTLTLYLFKQRNKRKRK